MNLENIITIVNTINCLFFGAIWKSQDILNLFVKVFLILLGLTNLFLTLLNFGYIVKILKERKNEN